MKLSTVHPRLDLDVDNLIMKEVVNKILKMLNVVLFECIFICVFNYYLTNVVYIYISSDV